VSNHLLLMFHRNLIRGPLEVPTIWQDPFTAERTRHSNEKKRHFYPLSVARQILSQVSEKKGLCLLSRVGCVPTFGHHKSACFLRNTRLKSALGGCGKGGYSLLRGVLPLM